MPTESPRSAKIFAISFPIPDVAPMMMIFLFEEDVISKPQNSDANNNKEKYPDEIANANYPEIRNFFVPTKADVSKVYADLPPGKWAVASPTDVLEFGAASYFFAKDIYLKYLTNMYILKWLQRQTLKNLRIFYNLVI